MRDTASYLVPTVIDSNGINERAYDIYSRLLKERIVPSWDFYLLLGGSLILPIVLYFVLRKRDAIKAKNRTSGTSNPHENNP